MTIDIQPLTPEHLPLFREHFARHRAESGRGEHHFMPFAPDDVEGPNGLNANRLTLPLNTRHWQRWFVAFDDSARSIVGHVDLEGSALKTALHRCELGIGIERSFRGRGLGVELMQVAITFARAATGIAWIDLRVFAHNSAARALYRRLGFAEVSTVVDCFRIGDARIDDVLMTLRVDQ